MPKKRNLQDYKKQHRTIARAKKKSGRKKKY